MPQPVRLAARMCIMVLMPRTSNVADQLGSGVPEASRLSSRPKPAPLRAPATNPWAGESSRLNINQTVNDLAVSSINGVKKGNYTAIEATKLGK